MKKTVGILTFHRSNSYGACLQAYATVKAIEQLGYHSELIDYTNSYEQKKHKSKGKGIKRVLKDLKWLFASTAYHDSRWINRAFGDKESFYEGHISKEQYRTHEELNQVHYDIMLSGSDQIWNPDITGQLDTAYLLEYGKTERRVAYASSMGSRVLSENETVQFRACLSRFYAIGVREEFAKNQLSELTDSPISVVCDPTILVKGTTWEKMADSVDLGSIIPHSKYAIAFFVSGYDKKKQNMILQTRKIIDVPVYIIQKSKRFRPGCDKCLAGVTVPEFVSLIKNSEYILTDSFHGVVFSLLLKKKFIPVTNQSNPVRVRELLGSVGLEELMNNPNSLKEEIDYESVDKKISQMREHSLKWLKNALS